MPENRFEQLFATTLIHLTGLRFGKGQILILLWNKEITTELTMNKRSVPIKYLRK